MKKKSTTRRPALSFEAHRAYREATHDAARALNPIAVYRWLVTHGYFPESYVLPPVFAVLKTPSFRRFYPVTKRGREYRVPRQELVRVHFPKSEMTDRNFGVMHPRIHNDVAYNIARNWKTIVDKIVPADSDIVSYSFPIPLDKRRHGRLGRLRSGRAIYEFLGMVDRDMASMAYRYSHLIKTDIKNFYPSIYTHSIAWALHGKKTARKKRNDFQLLGNRLDRLFQQSNDGCTNGIAIGPAVSDVAAELIASAVDVDVTRRLRKTGIKFAGFRFKDDYRFLVKSEADGRALIKQLQSAMRMFNLELSDEKTAIHLLPDGLFREWSSMYFAVHPRRRREYSWREFRELYLAVLRIDRLCPGTGVIDKFLADIVSARGRLKVPLSPSNLSKVLSMLLMLGVKRIKAFPKVLAIIETVIKSPFGSAHRDEILDYLNSYLNELADDEDRNKYLIAWVSYFFVSNGLKRSISFELKFKDPITRAIFNNRGTMFRDCPEYRLFGGCVAVGRKVSLLRHLEVFKPPPELEGL